MRGRVVRLSKEGKFGFIEAEDGKEFFFHLTGLSGVEFGELAVGSRVEFTEADRQPGEHPRAVHVELGENELPVIENEPLPPEKP